jgi:hypothetical protein
MCRQWNLLETLCNAVVKFGENPTSPYRAIAKRSSTNQVPDQYQVVLKLLRTERGPMIDADKAGAKN